MKKASFFYTNIAITIILELFKKDENYLVLFILINYVFLTVVQLTPFDDLIIKWSYTAPYISYKKVTGYFLAQYLFTYDSYYKSICRIIVYTF